MHPGYLSGVLHIVLLARAGSHAAGGGGTVLLSAAQHDGVLVQVSCSLHRHGHCARLLTHIVAEETSEDEKRLFYFNPAGHE